jgi:hypothetical protein
MRRKKEKPSKQGFCEAPDWMELVWVLESLSFPPPLAVPEGSPAKGPRLENSSRKPLIKWNLQTLT